MNEETTWSPTASPVTPSPTSTTSPAPSWPRTSGGGSAMVPLVAERSEWQTPQAAIFTVTSPRFGPSTEMVSTTTGLFSSRKIAALPLRAIWNPPVEELRSIGERPPSAGRRRPHALQFFVQHVSQQHLARRRDAELSIARPLVELRMPFLEEPGVGGELDLAVAHAVAHQDFARGERLAAVLSHETAYALLVDFDHDAPVLELLVPAAPEGFVGDPEAQRHVVALHQRAWIDGREFQSHHGSRCNQLLALPDGPVGEPQHREPGYDCDRFTHLSPPLAAATSGAPRAAPRAAPGRHSPSGSTSRATWYAARSSSATGIRPVRRCPGRPGPGSHWRSQRRGSPSPARCRAP